MNMLDKREDNAVVVGGSVATFLPGVMGDDREDVLLANLYAQRVTRDLFNKGQIEDWFAYYKNTLKYLGWDATPPADTPLPGPDRERVVDAALAMIGQDGREHYAQACDLAVKRLANDDKALTLFESSARSRDEVRFQLLPCMQSKAGQVDLVLFHQEIRVPQKQQGFLFLQRSSLVEVFQPRVELVRFNTRLFRQERRAVVARKMAEASRQYIMLVRGQSQPGNR
ncbi:hypothetical protein QEP73_08055 [Pseudomonas defluvii]|nr:hypothetical protein QEP73_08055 [Pseudomonas defluvii]